MCPASVKCRPDRSDARRFGVIPPADTVPGGTPTGTRSSPRSGAPDAGHLRHCAFVAMRDDKKPAEVVREPLIASIPAQVYNLTDWQQRFK